MKKIWEIINIIITAVLTVASLIRLIPDDSNLGKKVVPIYQHISNNSFVFIITVIIIFILAASIIVKAIIDIVNEKKQHSFEVGSKSFIKFFSKWYSRQGEVSIICSDMKWTITEKGRTILDTLLQKCNKKSGLTLYVKKPIDGEFDPCTKELEEKGAKIVTAPEELLSSFTYSTISVMGTVNSIIVRDKHKDSSGKIVFEEVNSKYLSVTLTTLLESLLKEAIHEH